MRKMILTALLCLALAFSMSACKKADGSDKIDGAVTTDVSDTSVVYADGDTIVSEDESFSFIYNGGKLAVSGYHGKDREIKLPEESGGFPVAAIIGGAFEYSELERVEIPACIENIEEGAFELCSSLLSITVDEENQSFCDIDGVLFSKDKTTLLLAPAAMAGSYTVPDGTVSIKDKAFKGTSLDGITLPEGISEIGDEAFSHATLLKDINIPQSVKSIGAEAFGHCEALVGIALPDSLTELGSGAFAYCTSLERMTLPAGITAIESKLFIGCNSLIKVRFSGEVTTVGDSAFYDCQLLQNFTLPDTVTAIGALAFRGCLCLGSLRVSDGVIEIGDDAFLGCGNIDDALESEIIVLDYEGFTLRCSEGSYAASYAAEEGIAVEYTE